MTDKTEPRTGNIRLDIEHLSNFFKGASLISAEEARDTFKRLADRIIEKLQKNEELINQEKAQARREAQGWRQIKTAEDLPKKPGITGYEQIDCLIIYGGEILRRMWNCEHLCWDNEDGDDFFCNPLDPTYWMPTPEPPK